MQSENRELRSLTRNLSQTDTKYVKTKNGMISAISYRIISPTVLLDYDYIRRFYPIKIIDYGDFSTLVEMTDYGQDDTIITAFG